MTTVFAWVNHHGLGGPQTRFTMWGRNGIGQEKISGVRAGLIVVTVLQSIDGRTLAICAQDSAWEVAYPSTILAFGWIPAWDGRLSGTILFRLCGTSTNAGFSFRDPGNAA